MRKKKTMTLDDRIDKDMTELCSGCGEISDAKVLFAIMREDRIRRDDNMFCFSTKGNPLHYVGNREAKTVLVMLNPGGDWENGDCEGIKERKVLRQQTPEELICFQHKRLSSFGEKVSKNSGAFDLKQAAFLKYWPESGVEIHPDFPGTKDDSIKVSVVKSVLFDKLQLELIPYCSRRFDTGFFRNNGDMSRLEHVFPFLETVFLEIGRCRRKYVVFCSDVFDTLLVAISRKRQPCLSSRIEFGEEVKVKHDRKSWRCRVIWIQFKSHIQKALIAHTFPSYSFSGGGRNMVEYGKFCFDVFNQAELTGPKSHAAAAR